MVIWNDSLDRQLLMTMIHLTPEEKSGKQWEVVAKRMGEGFTAEATRQHYQKLRLEYTNANGEQNDSTRGASKAKAGKAGNKAEQPNEASPAKTTPRKRTKKVDSEIKVEKGGSGDGDHELPSASPKKKVKSEH